MDPQCDPKQFRYLLRIHRRTQSIVVEHMKDQNLYRCMEKGDLWAERCAGQLITLALLPNEEAKIAAALLKSKQVRPKYRYMIHHTIKDLLGHRGLLIGRREIPGLQLPSPEACKKYLPGRQDWSHLQAIHDMYIGASMCYEAFLSVVGRYVCQDGKIWDFGNKLDPGTRGGSTYLY